MLCPPSSGKHNMVVVGGAAPSGDWGWEHPELPWLHWLHPQAGESITGAVLYGCPPPSWLPSLGSAGLVPGFWGVTLGTQQGDSAR